MNTSMYARTLSCALLLCAGITGAGGANPLEDRPAPDRETDAPRVIRGRGTFTPAGYEDIRCHAAQPRAVLFIVPPGRIVKKGDLLVELDTFGLTEQNAEQTVRLKKAQAELEAAKASLPTAKQAAGSAVAVAERALHMAQRQLEDYRTAEYPAQKEEATYRLTIAKERAMTLEGRMQRLQAALKEQQTSPPTEEFEEAQFAWMQAKADVALMESGLKLLNEVRYPQKTEELELAVAQRKLDLLRAENELEQTTRQGETAADIATLELQMEKDRFERIQHEISACTIYAPRDGTVFSANDAALGAPCEGETRPGDAARPGQVLLRLADPTQLKLDARVNLPLAQRIAPGQTATVLCDAFPGRPFSGHLANMRILTNSEGPDSPVEVMVTIRLDDPIKGLKPGMAATFEVDTAGTR